MREGILVGVRLLMAAVPGREFGRHEPARHVRFGSWLYLLQTMMMLLKGVVNNRLLCRLGFRGMRLVIIIGRMFRQRLLRMVL